MTATSVQDQLLQYGTMAQAIPGSLAGRSSLRRCTEWCFFSPDFPLYNKFLVNASLLGSNFNLHYQLYRLTVCVPCTLPHSISSFNYVERTKENYNRCLCCAAYGLNESRELKGEKSHENKHKLH